MSVMIIFALAIFSRHPRRDSWVRGNLVGASAIDFGGWWKLGGGGNLPKCVRSIFAGCGKWSKSRVAGCGGFGEVLAGCGKWSKSRVAGWGGFRYLGEDVAKVELSMGRYLE